MQPTKAKVKSCEINCGGYEMATKMGKKAVRSQDIWLHSNIVAAIHAHHICL